ncbi:MAG TPA: hypothetical protein VJT31_17715 [Rugosimonospora sp.]|nr:hypothetical protein [Rugosimonospora sp.]
MLPHKLLTTIAVAALATGAVAGCATTTTSTHPAAASQQNPLTQLVSDVTGSLQKAASSTGTVTSVDLSMTGTSGGVRITGTGAIAFQPLKADLNVVAGTTGTTTVRIVDSVIYVKLPAAQQSRMMGKTWLKLSAASSSLFGSASRQLQDVNPVDQVKTLLASGSAVAVGQETINGVPTVHYRATTSVDTALKQVDPKLRDLVKSAYDKAGVKEITTEIWIDAQYRPHRAHVLAGTLTDLTVDYRDFNKPVTVSAPPANDTLDLSHALPGLGA